MNPSIKSKILYLLSETISELNSSSDSSSSSENNLENDNSSDDCSDIVENYKGIEFVLPFIMHSPLKKIAKERDYLRTIRSWTDYEFRENFKINRNIIYKLIDELEQSTFIPHHTFGAKCISAEKNFIIFLWFLSNNEPLRTISDKFNISISSAFRVLRRVVEWMCTKLNNIIKWPQKNDILKINNEFYNKQQIPSILGAINCMNIPIEKPSIGCNDKKYSSIKLQAVVDSKLRFINLYCGESGTLNNTNILIKSPLYESANWSKDILFPLDNFLIGNYNYPSLSWLVSEFKDNGDLTKNQIEFNNRLMLTGNVTEIAFNQLKGRFKRLKNFTEYKSQRFIVKVVIAACILHNICINENDNYDFINIENTLTDNIKSECDNNEFEIVNNESERRSQLFYNLYNE